MDDWEKLSGTLLPERQDFYSYLNMEDITDGDTRIPEEFVQILKNLGKFHDLHAHSNTILLVDVFEKFQNMCLEICEIDLVHFLAAPRLAWQAALKNISVKLDLSSDFDM